MRSKVPSPLKLWLFGAPWWAVYTAHHLRQDEEISPEARQIAYDLGRATRQRGPKLLFWLFAVALAGFALWVVIVALANHSPQQAPLPTPPIPPIHVPPRH